LLVQSFPLDIQQNTDTFRCLARDPPYARARAHTHTHTHTTGLVSKGNAYEKDGSVYFDVNSFKGYGKLARLDFDNMQDGAGEGGGISLTSKPYTLHPTFSTLHPRP
jgi:cysteinyl-tRNA synthetase